MQERDTQKSPEGIHTRILSALLEFFMTLCKPLTGGVSDHDENIPQLAPDATHKEDFRPPSPIPAFTEVDLLSSVLKKLSELEEKVDMLQAKPSEMPYEKEELLNAAVCRVDALEAELIATKKV